MLPTGKSHGRAPYMWSSDLDHLKERNHGNQPHRSDTIPPTETSQQQDWFVPETIRGRAASPYHYPLSTPFQPIPVMRRCDVVATHVCSDFQRSPAIPNGLSEVYKLDLPGTGDVVTSPLSHPLSFNFRQVSPVQQRDAYSSTTPYRRARVLVDR